VLGVLLGAPAASAAGAPQIGPAWTSGVGTTTAGLRAEINPGGLATSYHFSYILESAYEANLGEGRDGFAGAAKAPAGADPAIGSGSAAVTVAQSAGSLAPDTAYRYRVQASNVAGTETGPARVFFTEAFAGASTLLDGRAWEMVSPVDKNGGQVQGPGESFGGGVFQAAGSGEAFTYSSTSSFGEGVQGAPPASQYTATRGGSGWVTANVTAPTASGAYGTEPDGVPYQLFSPDLARALLFDGHPCGSLSCPLRYSLRESAGGGLTPSPEAPDLRFAGAGADLSQVILSTCAKLTSDATEMPPAGGCEPAQTNLYRWFAGGLALVNLPPAASQGTPGASLAARAGAVSADGGRVYWTLGGNLYLREGAVTKQADAGQGGGGAFQAASATGAIAFFTKEVSPGDTHLFRYLAAPGTATDVTPAGGVAGVLGTSADGEYVYYLTAAGLFLRHGEAAPVEVADGADASNYPPATGTARVSPDGTRLAFLSRASLTGYDNRDASTGTPLSEVFLYDAAAGTLVCASCKPTGERPIGASSLPGALANGAAATATRAYKPRALSDDGRRLFFDSADSLALADTANRPDVYEWEAEGAGGCRRPAGCLGLVSRGRNSEGASFLDASASGADVFFLTADSLVGADTGFADVYDAREGGGFPEAAKPIECAGDACQFLPSEPEDPTPGTLVPSPGNPSLRWVEKRASCKKGFARKRGRCVRGHHKKRHRRRRA
jgi:hypothetical protein